MKEIGKLNKDWAKIQTKHRDLYRKVDEIIDYLNQKEIEEESFFAESLESMEIKPDNNTEEWEKRLFELIGKAEDYDEIEAFIGAELDKAREEVLQELFEWATKPKEGEWLQFPEEANGKLLLKLRGMLSKLKDK